MTAPEISYAKTYDGLDIAYLTHGDGPIDIVVIPGHVSHLEMWWERPEHARFADRLAAFARVIQFDKRGTGLSSRLTGTPDLETRADDMRAVLDAVGAERVVILGNVLDGTALGAMFAATHPERTAAVILWDPAARGAWAPDYPWGETADEFEEDQASIEQHWGRETFVEGITDDGRAPSWADDAQALRFAAKYFRNAATPTDAAAFSRLVYELDVREILSAITAPTLIMYREGWDDALLDQVRYVAGLIPHATLVGLYGSDAPMWLGDQEEVASEVQQFLTGVRPVPELDRVLATVLFTDIVGSTERASELGDARWTELLASHHQRAHDEIARFRGTYVKDTGDGILATFDGPARAVRCAAAIGDAVRPLDLQIRAGVHAGEIELVGDDIGGVAVHIGARVAAAASPGDVLVSSTVRDLTVGSGLTFEDAGEHELKGVQERWRLYRVVS